MAGMVCQRSIFAKKEDKKEKLVSTFAVQDREQRGGGLATTAIKGPPARHRADPERVFRATFTPCGRASVGDLEHSKPTNLSTGRGKGKSHDEPMISRGKGQKRR